MNSLAHRIIGSVRPLLLALALAVAVPCLASAQVRIVPQVGLWAPLSDLPSAEDAVEVGERESSLAFGLAAELGSLRVGILHGTGSEVPVSGVGCTECPTSTVTTLTGAFLLRPGSLPVVNPYVLLGAGVRRLDFDREDLEEEQFDAIFSDQNDLAGQVGVGVDLNLPIMDLRVELSDVVSRLTSPDDESEIQHDLFLMLGVVF